VFAHTFHSFSLSSSLIFSIIGLVCSRLSLSFIFYILLSFFPLLSVLLPKGENGGREGKGKSTKDRERIDFGFLPNEYKFSQVGENRVPFPSFVKLDRRRHQKQEDGLVYWYN
jgi:hypothetical protein